MKEGSSGSFVYVQVKRRVCEMVTSSILVGQERNPCAQKQDYINQTTRYGVKKWG